MLMGTLASINDYIRWAVRDWNIPSQPQDWHLLLLSSEKAGLPYCEGSVRDPPPSYRVAYLAGHEHGQVEKRSMLVVSQQDIVLEWP